MRRISIGLLLLILPGCVKFGPTPEEAKAAYEIEVQKLAEIEAQIAQSQERTLEALKKRKASEEMTEAIAAFKVAEAEKKQLDELQKELRHNLDKVAELGDEQLKHLKSLRKEQQIRTAEAKRRWDAAE